jgi:hypothetical protein
VSSTEPCNRADGFSPKLQPNWQDSNLQYYAFAAMMTAVGHIFQLTQQHLHVSGSSTASSDLHPSPAATTTTNSNKEDESQPPQQQQQQQHAGTLTSTTWVPMGNASCSKAMGTLKLPGQETPRPQHCVPLLMQGGAGRRWVERNRRDMHSMRHRDKLACL